MFTTYGSEYDEYADAAVSIIQLPGSACSDSMCCIESSICSHASFDDLLRGICGSSNLVCVLHSTCWAQCPAFGLTSNRQTCSCSATWTTCLRLRRRYSPRRLPSHTTHTYSGWCQAQSTPRERTDTGRLLRAPSRRFRLACDSAYPSRQA